MHDELLALYAELQALADTIKRQQGQIERIIIRVSTMLPQPEPAGPPDPDRAKVYRQGEKEILRADLLRAVRADLERAVNLGLPVDAGLRDALEGQTNASLYGAGIELRHRLRAHTALAGRAGDGATGLLGEETRDKALDLEAKEAPGLSAQARGA